ncbi:MAG: hypothetical protein ACXWQO_03945 [Bdellovibrionota bacterium]
MKPSIVLLAFAVLLISPAALALEYTKAIPGKTFGLDYIGGGFQYEGLRHHSACQIPERLIQPGAGSLEVVTRRAPQ